jgi:hypothetical protein
VERRPPPDRARSFRFIAMSLGGFGIVALLLSGWLLATGQRFAGMGIGFVGITDLMIAFLFFRRSSDLS